MHASDNTGADPTAERAGAGRQPAIFIGHGSPMNIVADNAYTRSLERLRTALAKPRAVLVVSAHWMTRGFFVGSDETNFTIHDFYGFPDGSTRSATRRPGRRTWRDGWSS